MLSLSTHPDLVEYLWNLDAASACTIDGRSPPLLSHPASGVIFGLARGTSTLAFRLPEPELGWPSKSRATVTSPATRPAPSGQPRSARDGRSSARSGR